MKKLTFIIIPLILVLFSMILTECFALGVNGKPSTPTPVAEVGIYIDTNGSDTNGNGTESKPYQTIQKGLTVADSNSKILLVASEPDTTFLQNDSINLDKNVTIKKADKSGSNRCVVDFGRKSYNFTIDSGAIVTFSAITITKSNGVSAVYIVSGNVTIDECIITGNTTSDAGGGIYINKGTCHITGSTIFGNTTNDVGGGIFNSGNIEEIEANTQILCNSANYGGGIFNSGTIKTIKNSTIGESGKGNTATYHGGGIYNNRTIEEIEANTQIFCNCAKYGGGIYNVGLIKAIKQSTIGESGKGNTATEQGGGIYNYGGNCTITGSTISGNTAERGGGIYNGNTCSITGLTISGNTAGEGGGIYHEDGTCSIKSAIISDNSATTGYGGGIYIANHNVILGTGGGQIEGNSAPLNHGGGVFNSGGIFANPPPVWGGTSPDGWSYGNGNCVTDNSVKAHTNNYAK